MVTIPLGLGMRWPKMPVVTLAIAAILLLLFIFEQGHDRSSQKTLNLMSDARFRAAKENLFLEYCRSIKESATNCAEILPYVAPDFKKMERDAKVKDQTDSKKTTRKGPSLHAKESPSQDKRNKSKKDNNPLVKPELKKPEIDKKKRHHISMLYLKFEQETNSPSASFRRLKSFKAYDTLKAAMTKRILSNFRKEHVLSKSNLRIDSLAFAQFRHGSWSHLFGNLLCLIPFGIYVELRMGALRYLLAYLAAGTIGLAFNAAFFLPAEMPLLGASANIAGVMGLFYVLFFHARMRFYLWFGLGQRLWVPVKYSLPVVFFISDITGAVQSLSPTNMGGGVAHFAHLGGLVAGIIIAWGIRLLRPLPTPFLYDDEPMAYNQLRAIPQLERKIHVARGMLEINLDNNLVRSATLEGILSQPTVLKSMPENQAHAFLFANLDVHCALSIRENKHFEAYRLIAAIPLRVPLSQYLGALGQSNHLIIADYALAQKNAYLALRLYDAFLLRWPSTAKAPSLRLSVIEILKALPDTLAVGSALKDYADTHPKSALSREIGLKITMIQQQVERHSPREDEYEPKRAG